MSITMAVAFATLCLATVAFVVYQYFSFRNQEAIKASILADVIAKNLSASVAFQDENAAQETLSALAVEKGVLRAVVINNNNEIFAHYSQSNEIPSLTNFDSLSEGISFDKNTLFVKRTISLSGENIGTVYLQTSLQRVFEQLMQFFSIVAIVFSVSCLIGFVIASKLQKLISAPITNIVGLTRDIADKKDYTLRANATSEDEIGDLIKGFNGMLSEIEKRDKALQNARDQLEDRVRERTKDLAEQIRVRQAIEVALRREQQQLTELIANAPVAIAMFDKQMRYISHSKQWLVDYAITEEDFPDGITNKTHYEVFPEITDKWKEIHKRCLAGEIMTCDEDLFARLDGSKMYLRWGIHPWQTPEGAQGGIIMVTERIDQLVKAREDALRTAEMKTEFLANVSHELRTPLNGVIGFSELLASTAATPEQEEYVTVIKSSAELLLVLINDLLDFSKIETGKLTLEEHQFKLRETVNKTIHALKADASSRNLELLITIDENVPNNLVGDMYRLQQLITNIVGNAKKFTQDGVIETKVKVNSIQNNRCTLLFSITDQGIGIPHDKQGEIFNAFSQADGSVTRKYGGTGLGLAICKQIAELMNGKIWVESEPGKGSTFHFTADFNLESIEITKSVDISESKPTIRENNNKHSILIAEDNPINQKLALKLLENFGYNVSVANNGQEAVTACENQKFDLILMDLQMPVMGGFEAVEQIRNIEKAKNLRTPIVALTAHSFEEHRKRCLEAGMDGFVVKPIKKNELFGTIEELLKQDT